MSGKRGESSEWREETQADYDRAAIDYVYWLNELSVDERDAHWDRVDHLKMEMALTDFWHARRWGWVKP